jgi:diaminopimelate epimerase
MSATAFIRSREYQEKKKQKDEIPLETEKPIDDANYQRELEIIEKEMNEVEKQKDEIPLETEKRIKRTKATKRVG